MDQLFSHSSIVQNNTGGIFEFYGCTLKKDIGDYKKGTYFSCIEFHIAHLELIFYHIDDSILMRKQLSIDF